MKRIDKRAAMRLHDLISAKTGGDCGIRDEGLLESALNSPFQTFGGEELYKTVTEKGARLCYSLVSNHSFVDGNKRIGILVMLTFFEINGVKVICSDRDLVKLGIGLADGTVSYESLLDWLADHTV